MNNRKFKAFRILIISLGLAAIVLQCGIATATSPENLMPPEGLSKKEFWAWEVKHMVAEDVVITQVGKTIYINNRYCPLQRRVIHEPIDYLTRKVKYKGRNAKYKGKSFVFNFCCGVCQTRFPKHFKTYPDEILKKFGL